MGFHVAKYTYISHPMDTMGTVPMDPSIPPKKILLAPKLHPFRAFRAADPWIHIGCSNRINKPSH